MRMPSFIRETLNQAKQSPLWGIAFFATALLPFMLIYARVGVEVCSAIIGPAFLLQSWRTKQWRWLRVPFTLACVAAWAWLLLVVTPLAQVPQSGLPETMMWFRLPLMFASLRYWVLANPAARATLGMLLGLVLALITLDCFVQFFTGMSLTGHAILEFNRLTGPFKNPKVGIYMSMLVAPAVAFCVTTGIRLPCKRMVFFGLGLLFLVIAAIVLSGERSAFLSIVLASVIALGLMMVGEKRLRIGGCVAGLAAVALILLLYFTNDAVQVRAAQMIDVIMHYPESPYGMLAGMGVKMGAQHWLHGVGVHGFGDLCPEMVFETIHFHGLHPHNYYSEWFAETGAPGLLLFIIMLTCLTRENVQQLCRTRGIERLGAAITLGVLVQHFFPLMPSQSFFTNWGALMQWYSLGLVFAILPRNDVSA